MELLNFLKQIPFPVLLVFIKSRISLVQIKSLLIFAIDIPNSNRNPTSFLPFDGCIRSCVASSVK